MRHAAYGLLLFAMTACGGSGAATHATTATAPATPAATVAGTSAATGNPVKGADFCAFLSQHEGRLKADGSPVGALADLAIEFSSWLDTHKAEKPRTAADLDEATISTCPSTRAAVLATLGKDSFEAALS